MNRAGAIRTAGAIILTANLLLAVAKGAVWFQTGSLAVGSEAINSLSDAIYSVVVLAGLYLTTQPPDFEHPHGHERIEPFVSLFVALGVFSAGGLVLWRAGTSILSGDITTTTSVLAVVVLVGTGVVKYGLYRYCLRVGDAVNSPAVVAAGLDNRNDILTATAALVGVLGARFGFPVLDPLAAGVVSFGILYTGWEIVRDNVDYLVGRAPPEDLRATIVQRALSHPDVEGVHDVVAHYVGPEIDVSMHIEVEGDRTLIEAHDIETDLMNTIRDIPNVDDVFIHIDPKELGEWKADAEADRLAETSVGDEEGQPDGSS
ncbi:MULTISPECIES: cation diffusion facilitator family transporter [unclassified Haladaptatus]|uniref:cation diffusion facilitator family transporter n=1 Tax=unclassified Haladaptatus TaxID=2622732 RepID=UPI00209C5357|nr:MULTISPECIES: cation diffusion facilitator family transporter [unclassified Haladaptatus]MCO8243174.1 cation diffusion facilitator family transporter [Haladaptatus sp. AB643]MCO8252886.1 cation diffusion facilitator family transporter [Haladaptatus sp. AB618]